MHRPTIPTPPPPHSPFATSRALSLPLDVLLREEGLATGTALMLSHTQVHSLLMVSQRPRIRKMLIHSINKGSVTRIYAI
jgi:hypothetical protein